MKYGGVSPVTEYELSTLARTYVNFRHWHRYLLQEPKAPMRPMHTMPTDEPHTTRAKIVYIELQTSAQIP